MYGDNIVAPPGNQAANRENKHSPVIRGPRSTRLRFYGFYPKNYDIC